MATAKEEYGDMHKLVLQGMMSAGILDAKGVKKLFIGSCSYLSLPSEERSSMTYVQKIVRDINEKIKRYDMAIRSASDELTGKKYYIFLVTVEKPILKLQTVFSQFEVGLFQKVLDSILRKYINFCVPFSECINLSREVEARGNLETSENFIRKLLDMNYLTKFPLQGEEFEITLGIRGMRELESLLRDCYSDVIGKCSLCKQILLHGYLCRECKLLIHRPCYNRYVATVSTCPNCSISWQDKSTMISRIRSTLEDEVDYDLNFGPGRRQGRGGHTPDDSSPPDLSVASPDDRLPSTPPEMPKLQKEDAKARSRLRSRRLSSSSSSDGDN